MGRRGALVAVLAVACSGVVALAAQAGGGTVIDVDSEKLDKQNGLVFYSSDSMEVGIGEVRGAAALCPDGSGRKVLGGGALVRNNGGGTMALSDSAPFGPEGSGLPAKRTWVGTFTNHSGISNFVTAYAVCGKPDSWKLRMRTEEDVAPEGEVKLRALCPRDTSVSGGGIEFSSDDGQFRDSAPFDANRDDDTKPDDGWKAVAYPPSTTDVTVAAVCVTGIPLAYRSTASDPLSDTEHQAQSNCKPEEATTGGGGLISGDAAGAWVRGTYPQSITEFGDLWAYHVDIGPGADRTVTTVAICKRA
jgi:hypothetical protein